MAEKKVLIVAATEREISGIKGFAVEGVNARFIIAGVGSVPTVWSLMNSFAKDGAPDIMIQAGIAGSFKTRFDIGSVVIPLTDCFADMGVDDNSDFRTLFDEGLADPDLAPFREGMLSADSSLANLLSGDFPTVRAITVNTASGSYHRISVLREMFDPDIESMEGAALYYVCSRMNVPAISLRSISNMVEPRDRAGWNIGLALESLDAAIKTVLQKIAEL
jgi:futalosine hydrolase